MIRIHSLLVQKLDSVDIFCKNIVWKMKKNFDKYWEQYKKVFEMVILFDLQRNLLYLRYALRKLYGSSEDMSIRRGDTLRPFWRSL